ncbi:hypothetical protein [Rhizobium ruizarguesonis]|nr:hypothetical protein [Rhizobium ruizarguesonis]
MNAISQVEIKQLGAVQEFLFYGQQVRPMAIVMRLGWWVRPPGEFCSRL